MGGHSGCDGPGLGGEAGQGQKGVTQQDSSPSEGIFQASHIQPVTWQAYIERINPVAHTATESARRYEEKTGVELNDGLRKEPNEDSGS